MPKYVPPAQRQAQATTTTSAPTQAAAAFHSEQQAAHVYLVRPSNDQTATQGHDRASAGLGPAQTPPPSTTSALVPASALTLFPPTQSAASHHHHQDDKPADLQPLQAHVPSLMQHCLATVGYYIHEYLEALGPQIRLLPPQQKMTLLAIARRRGTLTDSVFQALCDEELPALDLAPVPIPQGADPGSGVTAQGCLRVIQPRLNSVQVLDISGRQDLSSQAALSAFAALLPSVKVLRCGGSKVCDQLLTRHLPSVLPTLLKPAVEDADSWEDAFPTEGTDQAAAGVQPETLCSSAHGAVRAGSPGAARFAQLQVVVWPGAPVSVAEDATRQCARLQFNPAPQPPSAPAGIQQPHQYSHPQLSTTQPHLDVFLDPSQPCDQPWVQGLPASTWEGCETTVSQDGRVVTPFSRQQAHGPQGAGRWVGDPGAGEEGEDEVWVPIADKFRQAYIDQANRIRKMLVKEAHRAQLRQLKASPALAAVDRWLDDC